MTTLRDATLNDVEIVTRLIHAAFVQYDGILNPPSGAHAESVDKIREKMEKGGALIALAGDEPAGCVLYYPLEDWLYLGRLAVLPSHRRQGIGEVLVAAVEARAAAMGLIGIQLGVRIALPRNRTFFESLGYQVVAYGSHPGFTEPTFMTLQKENKA